MEKFIKSNARASLFINVVINTVIPFFILKNENVIYLKEGSPILLPNILAAVVISALMTTLVTFFLMTQKRKNGEIDLPINPNTSWFPKALLTGFVIALGLGLLSFFVLKCVQMYLENIEIPKNTVLLMSAILGGLTGFVTAFIATNRASKLK